jgi:hypothetical protein
MLAVALLFGYGYYIYIFNSDAETFQLALH